MAGEEGEEDVFGEEFDDAAGGAFGEIGGVDGKIAPGAGFDVEDGVEFVGCGFVGGEEVEIGVLL